MPTLVKEITHQVHPEEAGLTVWDLLWRVVAPQETVAYQVLVNGRESHIRHILHAGDQVLFRPLALRDPKASFICGVVSDHQIDLAIQSGLIAPERYEPLDPLEEPWRRTALFGLLLLWAIIVFLLLSIFD